MSNYYVAVNGQQTGPYPQQELIMRGVTPETLVWCEGMSDWQQAGTIPELMYLFSNLSQPQPQQPYMQQPSAPFGQQPMYGQPMPGYGQNIPSCDSHPNYKTLAIIATVVGALFSCIGLIFGAIAIGKADSANKAYAIGDEFNGDLYNKSAKTFVIVAFVFAAIGLIGTGVYMYMLADMLY